MMVFKNLLIWMALLIFAQVNAQELNVMSYNIKYANENDGVNSWSNRKADLVNQIKYYLPDVLGMQEVLLEQRDYLLNEVPVYNSVGAARDDGNEKGEFSPVFYNTEILNLLQFGTFWLSENPSIPGKGWDSAYPRICTYAKFSVKDSGIEFWVFNTHFDHLGINARKNSLTLIQKKIKDLNTEGLPFLLMGDFNLMDDSSEIANFLINMQFDFPGFSDAFDYHHYGKTGTFNGYSFSSDMPRIDYIFSYGFSVSKHRIIGDKRNNGLWFSDHLPVNCSIQL